MSVDKRESRVVVTQRQVTQVVSSGTQGPAGGQWANWDEIPDKPSTYPPSAHNHDTAYDPLGAAASAQAAAIAAAATDASTKASAAQSAAILAAAGDATTKASAAQTAAVAAAALDATGKIDALKDGVAADGDTLAKLRALIQGIQTLLTSDNINLDTLQEVVDFVELHQTDLEALGATKVNISDIINALNDTSSNKPLSAAQGKVLKDALDALTAVVAGKQPAGSYVVEGDARLSDAREWSAATVDQAEAEGGTSTTRRAWTAQRVWQAASTAIAEWWSGTTSVFGRAWVAVADAAAGRTALGLGTIATQDAASVAVGTLTATGQLRSDASVLAASGAPVSLGNTTDGSFADIYSPSPSVVKIKTAGIDTLTVSALTGNTSHTVLNIDTAPAANFLMFRQSGALGAILGSEASIFGANPDNYGTYLYEGDEYFVAVGAAKRLRVLSDGIDVIGKLTTSNVKEDGVGNLAVGAGVPKPWAVGKAIDVGLAGAFFGDGINASWSAGIAQNAYASAYPGTWSYKVTGIGASRYQCNEALHQWSSAPAGVAGEPVPFNLDMVLQYGRLLIGNLAQPLGNVNLSVANGVQVNHYTSGGGFAAVAKPGGGVDLYNYTGIVGEESYTIAASLSDAAFSKIGGYSNPNPNPGAETPYAGAAYEWSILNPGYQGHLWRAQAVQPAGRYVDNADLVFSNPVIGESFRLSPLEGIKAKKSLKLNNDYAVNQRHGVQLTNSQSEGSLTEFAAAFELISDNSGEYRAVLSSTMSGTKHNTITMAGPNVTVDGALSAGGQIYSVTNIAAGGEVTGLTVRAAQANLITDWNAAVTSGDFMAFEGANAPTPYGWYIGRATAHNTGYVTQEAWLFTANNPVRFRRHSRDWVWSAWVHTGEWSSSGLAVAGAITTNGLKEDAAGNLALGVAPSAWVGFKAYQAIGGSIASGTGLYNNLLVASNAYYNGSGYTYIGNEPATLYRQLTGAHAWYSAPSGTAGDPISFAQDMTLQNGNLGLGVTPSAWHPFTRSIDISSGAFVASGTTTQLSHNGYWDGAFKYKGNGFAAEYRLNNADGSHIWLTAGNNTSGANAPLAWTSAMTLDNAGNLGLGVTPSAWGAGRNIETGRIGNFVYGATGASTLAIGANAYQNDGWKYANSASAAGMYDITGNAHTWYSAPSGNAGDPISFVQDMTLQNGNLGLGVTPSASVLPTIELYRGTLSSLGGPNDHIALSSNAYPTGSADASYATWRYLRDGEAARYENGRGGQHLWFTAPTGTAGSPISFTQAMTLDASGNLLVGATSGICHRILKGLDTGDIQLTVGQTDIVPGAAFYHGNNSTAPNAASSLLKLGLMNVTGRSINAAGTINASGADYAEYERNNGLSISKGSVVGFKADGTLTLTYSEAIRFGVKSTDPSYVGGDVWGSEDQVGKRPDQPSYTAPTYTGPQAPVEPVKPAIQEGEEVNVEADDAAYLEALNAYQEQLTAYFDAQAAHKAAVEAAEAAHAEAMVQYEIDKAAFDERLEAARQTVDRIAYSGKVPVNVLGATPGGYIVAAEGETGEIVGEFVADPDFAQYKKAVGRVNRVLEDGRCEVAVIVH